MRNATIASTDPEVNDEVLDGPNALRASPDSTVDRKIAPSLDHVGSDSPLSDVPDIKPEPKKRARGKKDTSAAASAESPIETPKKGSSKATGVDEESHMSNLEVEEEEFADEEDIKKAISRPPPVNSDYLPLPWKGRLGYVSYRRLVGRPFD